MEFICIATAHFVALLSPGPDFFLIFQAALRLPLRYCLAICAGIATANGVYLLLAVFGLEAISQYDWLVTLLRYGGSCYLIYLGILLLSSPRQQTAKQVASDPLTTTSNEHCGPVSERDIQSERSVNHNCTMVTEGHSGLGQQHAGRQFLIGFLSGILNPKNMIFYLSLFTAMVSVETGFATRCFYGLWMASVVLCWDCLLVLLVQHLGSTFISRNKTFYLEKGSGTVLIFLGASLLFG